MTSMIQVCYEDVQIGNVLDVDGEGWTVLHRTEREGDMIHVVVQDESLDYHILLQQANDEAYVR